MLVELVLISANPTTKG